MSSGYSVGIGGGGPAWQRGLSNLQTFLGALEARKQKRRQEEAKRRQEEVERQREAMAKRAGEMSKRAWTMGMPGMPPGLGMALGPLMGSVTSSAVRGMLGQMPPRTAAPEMPGGQPPGAGGGWMTLLMDLLRRNPQFGSVLGGPEGAGGALLSLLRRTRGGIPAGIGRIGGPRTGWLPPDPPYTRMA